MPGQRGRGYSAAAQEPRSGHVEAAAGAALSVASMTGFARRAGGDGRIAWTWEVKSVNGRSLDVRCRLPSGYDALEPAVRGAVQARCARGNVQVSLSLDRAETPQTLQVNRELLNQLLALVGELQEQVDAAPPRLDGLLAVRGVVETVEEPESEEIRDSREVALKADLEALIEDLAAARRQEGARLEEAVRGHLEEIARLAGSAAESAAAQPDALRERLRQQVNELLQAQPGLPEERLAQEAAVLATKADVREELDRLQSHVTAARELLDEEAAVGRRLDFLCQELNREANTLCAKSPDTELTRIGLALKNAVEQLREQVQNVE